MFKILAGVLTCCSMPFLFGQTYWQQEVNYSIQVKLDDVNHRLSAYEEFEYINHSPDELTFLYIHLWPNAYMNEKTALGKQLYHKGDDDLKYGGETVRGSIDSLDFKVDGVTVKWELDPTNPDICKLWLNQPLKSGGRIRVSTPFRVKIPSGEISRLGHIDQSYQITQWYPKPAVYDKNGWNPIPYLTQGEFYSEYGSFDVQITVPSNYVVGATGDLQTSSEMTFLNELARTTAEKLKEDVNLTGLEKFPPSSQTFKTIRYTQANVHDFAWFADKRYWVLKGEVELPYSKRKVNTYAMFTPANAKLWKKAIEYINDGTYYYSLWNGDYPYNNVTAVDGTISAGGGMEYPTITVIGNASSAMELEIVIVHEVGHNWFYGILGSNERVHGWMDEGLNTLNEMRYIQTKYPNNTNMSDMVLGGRFHMNDLDHHDMGDIFYRTLAVLGEDQPLETHSADFTDANYGAIMYQKTGLIFFYLKDYLGEANFDRAMKAYFEEFKFKHPQPEDIRRVLESHAGKKLDWFFNDLVNTTNHIDYHLGCVHRRGNQWEVTVKNRGQVDGPIPVNVLKDGQIVETQWVEPGIKKARVQIQTENPSEIKIDAAGMIPEIKRGDNNWYAHKMLHRYEKLKLEFLIGDHERDAKNNFWTPVIGVNAHDKFMVGAAFHNIGLPPKKFQYLVAPMYSVGRKSVSGISEMSYSFLPKRTFKVIRVGLSARTFKNDSFFEGNDSYYAALMPYVHFKLGQRKKARDFSQSVLVQTIYRYDQFGTESMDQAGGYVKYQFDYSIPDHQVKTQARFDYMDNVRDDQGVARASWEGVYRYRYLKNKMKRWIEIRAFVGGNLSYRQHNPFDNRYQLALSGSNGFQDIFLEDYFFDRTRSGNLGSNTQRLENQGGFRTTSNFGSTSTWLTAANFYMDLPIKPGIIGIYADAGGFDNNGSLETVFTAGIGIRLQKIVGVYFPLVMSNNLNSAYDAVGASYAEKIRVTVRLNIVNKSLKLSGLI